MRELIELLQRCAIWIQSAIERGADDENAVELLEDIEEAIQQND